MCTAATYKTKGAYYGRTLDYEFSYGEEVCITPRNYRFDFRYMGSMDRHYAIIGMAFIPDGYPLYYVAMNEKGLWMAGLNFVGNAVYADVRDGFKNVAQYEFIPWVLSQCADINDARTRVSEINLVGTPYSDSTDKGLAIYDNPAGVLTNNPPFDMQMFGLNNYMQLSPKQPDNRFSTGLELKTYSRGMGALGLPGDLSSASRFVRVAYTRANSVSGESETESVGQFFHILGSVEQQRGCCEVSEGKYEITIYTSCCSADKGIYYYTTYNDRQINAVDMNREDLDGSSLKRYPLINTENINYVN